MLFKRALLVSSAVFAFGIVGSVVAQDATPAAEMEGMMEEGMMSLEDAPAWVLDTAERAAEQYLDGAALESVQFDSEGEVPTYEFGGTAMNGEIFEIDVYPNGHLSEVEIFVDMSEVPAEAMSRIDTYLTGFQAAEYERSTRPTVTGLIAVWYEIGGTAADGSEIDVEVREDGSEMVIEFGS